MTEEKKASVWPLPKFYFLVRIGNVEIHFQEVSGLDTETQIIEYRHGNSTEFSPIKMPGIKKIGNVTLKKGIFRNDNTFWDWHNQIKMNTVARKTVVISLLDEGGNPAMVWTLNNSWPTKITGTDLKADGSEVAVETIEVAHEGITIANK